MKKFLGILILLSLVCLNAEAAKMYTYDSQGNRIYADLPPASSFKPQQNIYDSNMNKTGTYKRESNGRINVYNEKGEKIKSYKQAENGRLNVYDKNGQRIRSYKETSTGQINVYDGQGNRTGRIKNSSVPQYRSGGNEAIYNNFGQRVNVKTIR